MMENMELQEPQQNSIAWIEWWVKQNSSGMSKSEDLLPLLDNPRPPPPIDYWQIYKTSGSNNDCMIHALLTDCSETFRKLEGFNKDRIAREFRKGPFLQNVLEFYNENDSIPVTTALSSNSPDARTAPILSGDEKINYLNRTINGKGFLKQEFLTPICRKFNFNILIYSTAQNVLPFEFEPNGDIIRDGPTFVMYNPDSKHFSAMSQDNGNFVFDTQIATRLKKEIMASLAQKHPSAVPQCDYANGYGFIDDTQEPKQWTVVSVHYPSYGEMNCIGLTITNNITNQILENVPIRFFQGINEQAVFKYSEYVQSPPPYSLPSSFLSKVSGRVGKFDISYKGADDDEEKNLVLGTELESTKDPTTKALEDLKKFSKDKLKKLEIVQWFFGSIPLDCENLQNAILINNINKRLDEFEKQKLLDKLYDGIFPAKDEKVVETAVKKTELLSFFTSAREMQELCELAKSDLVLNNVANFNEVARQPKYALLFSDKGIFIQPPQNKQLWTKLLKELEKTFKLTKTNVLNLLPYLEGSNKLLAYRKAAKYNIPTEQEVERFSQLQNLTSSKWLREILTIYKLSGFPIQIALDFHYKDIDDAFVKDISEEDAKKREVEDSLFLNGKEFVKSMVTNRSIPTTFKLANEFAGSELKQKKITDSTSKLEYYVTQKIPLLNELADVFISKEIQAEVEIFEEQDKNPNFDALTMEKVSVPLFIIFSCLKRKKMSRTELNNLWEAKKKSDEESSEELNKESNEKSMTVEKQTFENFIETLGEEGTYEKDKNGDFIFSAFHTSIIILCNGKIYTLGYGSDPLFDEEQKEADAKIKYLKTMEGIIKKITGLNDVQVLGTGFIYSPDSLNIDDEVLNYKIIDIGILKKSNIIRLNKILATVKKVKAITMVVEPEAENRKIVTIEQLSGQTMCIYSRLASRYTQSLPFASQFMNCSSFVELGFPDRIDCTAIGGYSNPNSCRSKTFAKDVQVPIKIIFNAYFGNGTIKDFKEIVGYESDIPKKVGVFNKLFALIPNSVLPRFASSDSELTAEMVPEGGALKETKEIILKKRKKQKRPKNTTAKKSSNK